MDEFHYNFNKLKLSIYSPSNTKIVDYCNSVTSFEPEDDDDYKLSFENSRATIGTILRPEEPEAWSVSIRNV
jgi:hypothetical protein